MDNNETIKNICETNVEFGWDMQDDYSADYPEGDAFLQNVVDTLGEKGIATDKNVADAMHLFCKLAKKKGLRFIAG